MEDLSDAEEGSKCLEKLSDENTVYKALLVDVIRYAGQKRATQSADVEDGFRSHLQQSLFAIYEIERVLTQRASKLLPL